MTDDEVRCDHCGQPTPRLYPPVEVELCDRCWAESAHDTAEEDEPEDVPVMVAKS